MSTTTRTVSTVTVNVAARATTFVASELVRIVYMMHVARGLPCDWLARIQKVIEDGFRVWLSLQAITAVTLEIYDANGTVIEAFKLPIRFDSAPRSSGGETFKFDEQAVDKCVGGQQPLPAGCYPRLFVHLTPSAPDLSGWPRGEAADLSHLNQQGGTEKIIETKGIHVDLLHFR